jgi:hypothetical protein
MRRIGFLVISGVGLSGLVAGTVLGLDRTIADELGGTDEIAPEPVLEAPVAARPGATAPTIEPEAEAVEPVVVEPAGIVMPDLTRERVDRATARMAELGLTLEVRDDSGYRIDRYSARRYRIRPDSTTLAAGAPVERGTVVRARAYELASFADGY